MTGPEHYKEAERLLDLADSLVKRGAEIQMVALSAAQVHATLALAPAKPLRCHCMDVIG